MKAIGLIPARLESNRLPDKVLKDICGLPMIVHVFKRSELASTLDEVYVATDSEKIKKVVESYGGQVIMTSSKHQTGSDRLAEACQNIECDIVVNIQGDEALVDPKHIDKVTQALVNTDYPLGCLVTPFSKESSPSDIKAVLNCRDEVMYISREDIPSNSRVSDRGMHKVYHIMPFKKDFLLEYSTMEKTPLEKIEFNEYLRVLENGYKIKAVHVDSDCISVDTPEDLEIVRKLMEVDKIKEKYMEPLC